MRNGAPSGHMETTESYRKEASHEEDHTSGKPEEVTDWKEKETSPMPEW